MINDIFLFLISFILPLLYFRGLFFLASHYFHKPLLRTKTGLQVHHLHYGVVLLLIAALILLFSGESKTVIALLGLGLMLDLFIPSLLMEGDRPRELEAYKKSLFGTILLFLIVIAGTVLLMFLI